MHASIWQFRGDPDELMRSYEALMAEVPEDFPVEVAFVDGARR